jgi:DNA-binding NarL/FixJ family response regulator
LSGKRDGTVLTRVMVVDDHEMFATSLALALDGEPDIEVVATARSLADARRSVAADRPDVVLLDQHLPDGPGSASIGELTALSPESRVVMLSADVANSTLIEATEAGALGFVLKSRPFDELVAGVRAAAVGETVLSPALVGQLVATMRSSPGRAGQALTPREVEVLRLIAEGMSNARIAETLEVSVNTVRNHVQGVLGKLGVHSKLEALAIAMRGGVLPDRPS